MLAVYINVSYAVSITALKLLTLSLALAAFAVSLSSGQKARRDYPVKLVPFTVFHVNDQFWAPRIEINRKVTIPFAFDKCEITGRVGGGVVKREQGFTAIPYYAWANRGRCQMMVRIPETETNAKPLAFPTIATTSKVTTSGRKNAMPINDGEEPRSSSDPDSYFDWWPRKGSTEWVEYAFEKPATVSGAQVYWFDDTGRGEVRVPANWKLLYKSGGEWKPVQSASAFGTEKDKYNQVTFQPVLTDGLRPEVAMQAQWPAGIQKWKVK